MNLKTTPDSPLGWLLLTLRVHTDRARSAPDRGASAIEFVIITAVLVALAGAVGLVIYNLVKDEADSIEIPDAPGGP
ncbi:hypothetical protein CLV30_102161 [Haloactinopolyspora alba]|uniref:Flp pilus assembly pilin Flp n=1 Tax=Haloactinopolyspora alba TaxID=648780 RepID=A0A2P8EBD8_9ACTN|nr:hypothetical protein [Haloactinopolyspora alba]PSL06773.1 hypothetical protein CLV30_102161 [Haloactinopolyspora alba]